MRAQMSALKSRRRTSRRAQAQFDLLHAAACGTHSPDLKPCWYGRYEEAGGGEAAENDVPDQAKLGQAR